MISVDATHHTPPLNAVFLRQAMSREKTSVGLALMKCPAFGQVIISQSLNVASPSDSCGMFRGFYSCTCNIVCVL